jgi:hypothetical protein
VAEVEEGKVRYRDGFLWYTGESRVLGGYHRLVRRFDPIS